MASRPYIPAAAAKAEVMPVAMALDSDVAK
jgi:hypothetical protein